MGLVAALVLAAAPIAGGPAAGTPAPVLIDHIIVHKAARTMELWAGGAPVRTLTGIQLGPHPDGPKQARGDGRTPEGRYVIDGANPDSGYHLSLHISYPSPEDSARAQAAGRDPGGAIFIHGQPDDLPNGAARAAGDWTAGCIAVSNAEIEALWDSVPDGTPIDITP